MCNEPTRSTQDQARERNGMTPVEMAADAGHAAMSGGELIEAMVRITTDVTRKNSSATPSSSVGTSPGQWRTLYKSSQHNY